jgi:hypothetical protein
MGLASRTDSQAVQSLSHLIESVGLPQARTPYFSPPCVDKNTCIDVKHIYAHHNRFAGRDIPTG